MLSKTVCCTLTLAFALVASAVLADGDQSRLSGDPSSEDSSSKKADTIEFTLENLAGEPVKLSSYAGKIVVLEWIDLDCPHVARFHGIESTGEAIRRYESKNVEWIGVLVGKPDVEAVARFRKENKIHFPILVDPESKVTRKLGVETSLHMFVLRDGKKLYEGAVDNNAEGDQEPSVNYVTDAIDSILAGKIVRTTYREPYGTKIQKASSKKAP